MLLPTYHLTGIAAVSLCLVLMVWMKGFLNAKHDATVLGLLIIGLFLFGGGIAAQIMFAPFVWAAVRQINRPLDWWRIALPTGIRPWLGRLWPVTLALGVVSFLVGLFIAIPGCVPGKSDPEVILTFCWAFIFIGGMGFYLVTFVAGFANDIEQTVAG